MRLEASTRKTEFTVANNVKMFENLSQHRFKDFMKR